MSTVLRHPVQLVIQNADLLRTIFSFFPVKNYPKFDHAHHYRYYVNDRHPLYEAARVNRLFRQVAIPVIFHEVSFEQYSRFHPALASTDGMKRIFTRNRQYTESILFPSIRDLVLYLPFIVDSDESNVRYLSARDYERGGEKPTILVDLKRRIINLRNEFSLDADHQPHLLATYDGSDDIPIEKWPRGFNLIRNITLVIWDLPDYSNLSGQEGEIDALKKSLKVILQNKINFASMFGGDRDQIVVHSANVSAITDYSIPEYLLRYPSLGLLSLDVKTLPPSSFLIQLGDAKIQSLSLTCLTTQEFRAPRWSGRQTFNMLQAFIGSSIQKMIFRICMSTKSMEELHQILSSSEGDDLRNSILQADFRCFPDKSLYFYHISDYARFTIPIPSASTFQNLFPRWSWVEEAQMLRPGPATRQLTFNVFFSSDSIDDVPA